MTDRVDKDNPSRGKSLSRAKKKGGGNPGRTGGPAPSTTPITSFFSSQPPPRLACPLCGQFVPRFKINEHIDVECQNFERSDSGSLSASSGVQLSPPRSPLKSPTSGSNKEKGETKTSPYFKKNAAQQVPREVCSKNVVRTLDLGSLSAKLSRKRGPSSPEKTQAGRKPAQTEKEINSETVSNSQKENQLTESLEDKKDCSQVADLKISNTDLQNTDAEVSRLKLKHQLDHKATSDQTEITPEGNSSSLKPSKRKNKPASTGSRLSFSKRAKHEEEERMTEETSLGEIVEADTDEPKPEVPPRALDASSGESAADSKSASLSEVGAGDQAADGAQPPRLPYYLRNFCTVLQAVLENEDDRQLFNQDDMSHVHAFESLSGKQKHDYRVVILKEIQNVVSHAACISFLFFYFSPKSKGRNCT